MIQYPDGLPRPLRDGYEFSPTNRIARTPMDSGRARQRVEFDSVPTFVPVQFLCTRSQAILFDAWADQVAGAIWFEMYLWTPLGYSIEQVRFTESPTGPRPIGVTHWLYTAQLEVRFKPQATEGYAALMPDYILLADIFDIATNQKWPKA